MSATYEPSAFGTYFNPKLVPPVLFVGVRKYPVEILHMEQLFSHPGFNPQTLGVSQPMLARPSGKKILKLREIQSQKKIAKKNRKKKNRKKKYLNRIFHFFFWA